MDEKKKVVKVNVTFVLAYIFVPLAIAAVCMAAGAIADVRGNIAVVLFMVVPFAAILWWCLASNFFYKRGKKKLQKAVDKAGFVNSHRFNGGRVTVIVDDATGKLALLFRWNPLAVYVLPASRIEKAWTDDGRTGAGFLKGSSCVSFWFVVDGVKVRVYTFTSNKRWKMDSDYILTGISKADMMVEILNSARERR